MATLSDGKKPDWVRMQHPREHARTLRPAPWGAPRPAVQPRQLGRRTPAPPPARGPRSAGPEATAAPCPARAAVGPGPPALPDWRPRLVLARPETVVRGHRDVWRLVWRSKSRPRPGRPRVSQEVR